MNPQEIKEIVETINTLNLNINDETTQKLADAVIPVVQLYLIKEYVGMILTFLAVVIGMIVLYKIITKIVASNTEHRKNQDY